MLFAAVHSDAIGTKRTSRDVCYLSASGAKADICRRLARMIDAAGADRSGAKLPSALRDQNIDLPQLRDDLFRFVSLPLPLQSLLDVKDIPQVGPLQWGQVTSVASVDPTRMIIYNIHTPRQ